VLCTHLDVVIRNRPIRQQICKVRVGLDPPAPGTPIPSRQEDRPIRVLPQPLGARL